MWITEGFFFSSNHAWNKKLKHLEIMGFLCKNNQKLSHLKCFSVDMFTAVLLWKWLWVENAEVVLLWGGRGKTCQGAKWNDKLLAHWNYGYPVSCILQLFLFVAEKRAEQFSISKCVRGVCTWPAQHLTCLKRNAAKSRFDSCLMSQC